MIDVQLNNIVFQGGGVKGVAYIGVINALSNHKLYNGLNGFAGTSAGSICAMLCALRVPRKDFQKLIWELNLEQFLDDSTGYIRDLIRVWRKFGFYKGNKLYRWITYLCECYGKNKDITFDQLYKQYDSQLVVVAMDMNTAQPTYFSKDGYGNLPIREAVRASVAIPLYFTAVKIGNHYFSDGGVVDNYPMHVFDYYETEYKRVPNNTTVGCKLFASTPDIGIDPKMNLKIYAKSLAKSIIEQIGNSHVKEMDWKRSIIINTGDVRATEFSLNDTQKGMLVNSGYNAADRFFQSRC